MIAFSRANTPRRVKADPVRAKGPATHVAPVGDGAELVAIALVDLPLAVLPAFAMRTGT